jgi:hypothetical protein
MSSSRSIGAVDWRRTFLRGATTWTAARLTAMFVYRRIASFARADQSDTSLRTTSDKRRGRPRARRPASRCRPTSGTDAVHRLGTIPAQNGVVQVATGTNYLGRLGRAMRTSLLTKPQVNTTKPPAQQGVSLERTTGLEPATLTLAR